MTNAIVRKIQIDLITDTPNPVLYWFNLMWDKLTVAEVNIYHHYGGEYIYYHTEYGENIIYFVRDDNNGIFWCNEYLYWKKITGEFNITKYYDVSLMTKFLVDNKLNSDVKDPKPLPNLIKGIMDNALRKYLNDK